MEILSMRTRNAILLALLFGASATTATAVHAGLVNVGASRIDITPQHPVVLAGYGGRTREHEGVDRPIHARALAIGIRKRAGTTWGIGITGVAGPGGGRPGKPVGTVHISVAGPHHTWQRRYRFHGDRDRVTRRSVGEALYRLYRELCS